MTTSPSTTEEIKSTVYKPVPVTYHPTVHEELADANALIQKLKEHVEILCETRQLEGRQKVMRDLIHTYKMKQYNNCQHPLQSQRKICLTSMPPKTKTVCGVCGTHWIKE